jgi:flagellar biosynthesis protein FlhA
LFVNPDGRLNVLTLDPKLEKALADSVNAQKSGLTLIIPPEMGERLVRAVQKQSAQLHSQGELPVILVAANLRLALWKFLHPNLRQIAVLSYNEIIPEVEVHSVGIVEIENAD